MTEQIAISFFDLTDEELIREVCVIIETSSTSEMIRKRIDEELGYPWDEYQIRVYRVHDEDCSCIVVELTAPNGDELIIK